MVTSSPVIIGGPASPDLAKLIAGHLGAEFLPADSKILSDDESYIRVQKDLAGKTVIVVQSTYPPPDKHIVQLLLILDSVKKMKVKKTIAIVPYLAYSRQNKQFLSGESVGAKVVLEAIKNAGADSLLVVQPHKQGLLSMFNGVSKAVSPIVSLAKQLPALHNPIVLAPDTGALDIAKSLALKLGIDYTHIEKERDLFTGKIKIKKGPDKDIKGKEVIIVDDIISSGETIVQAAIECKKLGSKDILVLAVHLLGSKDSYDKIREAGVKTIIGSNTVPNDFANIVDISKEIADSCSELI